ncbi:MAG: hypothetical protein HY876_01345 [Coriobacteriales bacterium]|nr:hypothetical protein [Coriobacteriales bacterium]
MTDTLAIAYTPAGKADSPNLKVGMRKDPYTQFVSLITVCMASAHRWNSDLRLIVVTTPDAVERISKDLPSSLPVQVLGTQFSHRPPIDFYPAFNASLFTLDAMEVLADTLHQDDRILMVDPDTVTLRPLDDVFSAIPTHGVLAYDAHFPLTESSQGLTGEAAVALHAQIAPDGSASDYRHYGGELYGFQPGTWTELAPHVQLAWDFALRRHHCGLAPAMVTEEHILNYALRFLPTKLANPYIRRIWTAPSYYTAISADSELWIWHLPAEKTRGLAKLAQSATRESSWFWTSHAEEWNRRTGRICAVTQRTFSRRAADRGRSTVRKALKRLSI